MSSKRKQEPSVFYVERPAPKKSKGPKKQALNYEPGYDERAHTREETPKIQHPAGGVGQERRGADHPPEKRAPSAAHKGDAQAHRAEASQKAPETAGFDDVKKEPEDEGARGGQAARVYEAPAAEEAAQQGAAQDEAGKEGGGAAAGRKGAKAPLSDERKAQLEAARIRANEVRKEKCELRRYLKDRAVQEERASIDALKREREQASAAKEKKAQAAWYHDPEKIPEPLPKKQGPKHLTPQPEPPAGFAHKTLEDTALLPPVVKVPESLKKYISVQEQKPADEPTPKQPDVPKPPAPKLEDEGSDEEEKAIRKKRRQLEKKRLEREEAEMDAAMQQHVRKPAAPAPMASMPPPARGGGPTQNDEANDLLYKAHMNRVRRAMLMESIFGGVQ